MDTRRSSTKVPLACVTLRSSFDRSRWAEMMEVVQRRKNASSDARSVMTDRADGWREEFRPRASDELSIHE
jgi:hypothetical protein